MAETSFGSMQTLMEKNGHPTVEYLCFERNGRPHRHAQYESFFVIAGKGVVICGPKTIMVHPGDLVTIPPKTNHWMEVETGQTMEGLLWYHDEPLQIVS